MLILKKEKIVKNIRLATQFDFDFISRWLKEEFCKNGEGFWNNLSIIESHFKEGQLFVYIHNNVAVGFITGPIDGPDILNVKKGYKRKGIGRKLFKYILLEVIRRRISVIKIECNPESSINFWKKMGFLIEKAYGRTLGYKIIEYKNNANKRKRFTLNIKTYSEEIYINNDAEPLFSYNLLAFLQNDNKLVFQKRLFLKKSELLNKIGKDLIISIEINGKKLFFDKAKRPQAEKIGIKESEHGYGYYIDYLSLKINE